MNHLLDWTRMSDDVWKSCLESALLFGEDRARGRGWANGKSLGLLFFNPSLRTRASMELAAHELGAFVSAITPGDGVWDFAWEEGIRMDGGEAEHIKEAVGVLSRYYDALGVRLFASLTDRDSDTRDLRLGRFVDAATVPVVNMESVRFHPCQSLADAAVLSMKFGHRPEGKRFVLCWTSHPKALPMAVPNSTVLAAARLGMDITIVSPDSHRLDADILKTARSYGSTVQESNILQTAVVGADIVYAKAWGGPMVYENPDLEQDIRLRSGDWRISTELMSRTRSAGFMHCLPVRRNVVVDDAVLDGKNAMHLDQAEYRLHAQKAILDYVWNLNPQSGSQGPQSGNQGPQLPNYESSPPAQNHWFSGPGGAK